MIQSGTRLGLVVHYWLFAVPQFAPGTRTSDQLLSLKYSIMIWTYVREEATRSENVAQTSEDQGAIQRPHVAKDPGFVFGSKKHTAGPIEENKDSAIVFKCSTWVLKWAAPKLGRICALICRATHIEVRVLFEGDTCTALVPAEVPKNFWKGRICTELL